jgi:hypothetical protein
MTGSTTLKVKALLLILMLAGNEAARLIYGHLGESKQDLGDEPPHTAEVSMKAINEVHCKWSIVWGGCKGDGCSFKPLPLDSNLSSSCRINNRYMLRTPESTSTFVQLHGDLANNKATELKEKCKDTKGMKATAQCLRSVAILLDTNQFMIDAELSAERDHSSNLTRTAISEHVESIMATLAELLGEDAALYTDLVKKYKANAIEVAKNPKDMMSDFVSAMSTIVAGNATEKAKIREFINSMPESTNPGEADFKEVQEKAEELKTTIKPGSARKLRSSLRKMVLSQKGSNRKTDASLLQSDMGTQNDVQGGSLFMKILMIVLCYIAFCAILSIVFVLLMLISGGVLVLLAPVFYIISIAAFIYMIVKIVEAVKSK